MKQFGLLLVAFFIFVGSATAQDPPRMELGDRISIVLPKGWFPLDEAEIKEEENFGQEYLKSSGVSVPTAQAKTLLIALSESKTTRMIINVAPFAKARALHDALPAASPSDLVKLEEATLGPMKRAGLLTNALPTQTSTFQGKNCITYAFSLKVYDSLVPWKCKIIQIPDEDRFIQILASYDPTHESQSLPLINAALNSIRIEPDPNAKPAPSSSSRGNDPLGKAIGGGMAAIVLGLVMRFLKKRKANSGAD